MSWTWGVATGETEVAQIKTLGDLMREFQPIGKVFFSLGILSAGIGASLTVVTEEWKPVVIGAIMLVTLTILAHVFSFRVEPSQELDRYSDSPPGELPPDIMVKGRVVKNPEIRGS